MNNVWTLAEHQEGELKTVSFELLARGRALADTLETELCSVVIGYEVTDDQKKELIARGADRVYCIDDRRAEPAVCETHARALEQLITAHAPQIVLAAATTYGRTVMPYLAVRIHAGLTADCTELAIEQGTGNLLQTRPAIGGNIMATIKTPDHRPQMATVRPRSSRPLAEESGRQGEIVSVPFEDAWEEKRVAVLSHRREEDETVSVEEAEIVVSGGRGLKKRDNFHLVEELAAALGAQVGASRDAVDRGWKSYPHQVGLSGKTISPRLYVAVGISGAVQHLAGIKTAETIVAINSDRHANILQIADFAIVGDLFRILPVLQRRLKSEEGL